ncbi:complement C1q-like protein 3 [Saccostrea cucullata]|uniref:complement C1q-like protein 3 n=1 Tax=Saccostrea cuccullata TaxID=36930 RepID=UPI002ED12A86
MGTILKAKVSAKEMKIIKTKQIVQPNLLQNSYSKVFGNTGNETSLVHQREVKQKSLTSPTSAQKRLLTGIQTTSSPFLDVVAFSSYISTYETHLTEDHTIKFDKIVTNIGNHYNPHSGLFTAPQHGVYVFTWTLYCARDGFIYSQLVVNSNVVGAMFTTAQGAGNIRASTWIVVVEINKDDVVYIRTLPNGQSHSGSLYSYINYRSSFNGWKLN